MMVNIGDYVVHFKHEFDSIENIDNYTYKILGIGIDTDSLSEKVVYQEINRDKKIWIRDKQEFLSKVDKTKYPNIHQEYRFEHRD